MSRPRIRNMTMKYIVSVSGGLGSAEALKRTIEKHGKENTVALFADVKGSGKTHYWSAPVVDELLHERFGGEAHDLYRFLWQLSAHFEIPIERLEDGRSIWRVFADNRAFRVWSGNQFVHKCSELLKRQILKAWITQHMKESYIIVLGMGWDEKHRLVKARAYWENEVESPLDVSADSCHTTKWLTEAGIEIPSAYSNGLEHNNCFGGCIAAGQSHYAQLYKTRKDIYLYWAYMERSIQQHIGKDVTILKDERNGFAKPMSLYSFIPRIEAGDYPKHDWGGCGCFVGQTAMFDMSALRTA